MKWSQYVVAGCCAMATLSLGCATSFERKLGTISDYHAILQKPVIAPPSGSTLLDGPDYLIGIEKADVDAVQRLAPCSAEPSSTAVGYCLNLNAYPQDSPWRNKIAEQNDRGKTLFVSHIARLDPIAEQIGSKRVCFLYNVYPLNEFPDATSCARPFDAQNRPSQLSVATGLTALEELEQELDARIRNEPPERKPTHVLVMSTGWNTLQVESIDNYQHWTSHLKQTAQDDTRPFRPLVIGITWPSEWPLVSTWLGPIISVFDKEHDADEVGYVTANVLIHKVLHDLKAKHDVQIVVVGHSFGGRAMATALNSRRLLFRDPTDRPTASLMLGLQPAFSIQRFGDGNQGNPYKHFEEGARKYLLSSSTKDWILKSVWITNPVGGSRGLSKSKERPERFQIIPLGKEGLWTDSPSPSPCQLVILDGSQTISGHHDVYSASIGRLMWTAIQRFAPASSWPGARPVAPEAITCSERP